MLYELKTLRRRKGVSQEKAASDLGVALGTYRTWEQCKFMPRDNALLKQIADYLGTSIEALFGYDMMPPGTIEMPNSNGMRYVPVYGAIAAGTPVEMQEVERHAPVPEEVMGKHPASFLLRVEGDSVNRRIINGYYALVDPEEAEPTNDRDLFAICVNGDSATIKRYRQLANGCELLPDSYDPTYRPIMFDYGQDDTPLVTIIGKVVYAVMPFDFDL